MLDVVWLQTNTYIVKDLPRLGGFRHNVATMKPSLGLENYLSDVA